MPTRSASRRRPQAVPPPSATSADAYTILYLYDMRRDEEMRKARNFVSAEFWPTSAEDILAIARAFPSPENTWMRQVTTYWEMAAAMVLRGALHEDLFYDCSGEMYCVYAKFRPYLHEVRVKLPKFLLNVEAVILRTREGRGRLERLERQLQRRQQKLAQRRAAIAATSAGYR
jgi:hypothetical protein